jgi:hypothetical protein
MHRHECNTHNFLFNLEKSNKVFFLYYIPYKEIKCWKNFKIMRKLLFNYSFYSHPEIGNFRVWQVYWPLGNQSQVKPIQLRVCYLCLSHSPQKSTSTTKWHTWMMGFRIVFLFFRITQYIGDTHNARTLIPMNTRTQTLPLGASSKTVPTNPQDWRSHHKRLAVDGNVTYHWKNKHR